MTRNQSVQSSDVVEGSLGSASAQVAWIRPTRGWGGIPWRELWESRELLYFLTWRHIQVRYKQTILGVIWAILQPLLTMAVFTLFFGRLGGLPSDNLPYAIFTLAALVPWAFFANALTQTANSVIDNSQLITKIYFPRLLVPLATVLSGLVDFVLALLVLFGMQLAYGVMPTVRVLLLPAFVFLALAAALGVGLWLSAMNVQFRDVKYAVPFVTQLWLFATPVAYPSTMLPEPWRLLYAANPMVGVVEGFRWSLLGSQTAPGSLILVSSAVALVLLLSGVYYFRRMEKSFADVV
jgi:lipopolysaccharide transport system permease protein